jgi:parallel beta helix pectate lyase-like protein
MNKNLVFLSICAMILSSYSTMKLPLPNTAVPKEIAAPPQNGQVNVKCTNSISDATTINSAIRNSAIGDEILISGQCLINKTIKLLGDRSYRGTSRTGTVLRQADGVNLIALLATDTFLENREWTGTPVSIRQMTLDGNRAQNTRGRTTGLILRSWSSVVEDLYVTDMSRDGIRLANKSLNGTPLVTSQVNGRISGSFINNSGRHGMYVELGVTDWNLLDNWIAFSGADGLHLEDVAGWVIERNHIYGVPRHAIYADHLFATTISDNYIEGFGETSQAGTWYGIYATVQGGAASTISDNRIFNFGVNGPGKNPASTYYYVATTVNYETGVLAVTGNAIRGMGFAHETGLHFTSGNYQLVVTSANNAVIDVETARFVDNNVTLSSGY